MVKLEYIYIVMTSHEYQPSRRMCYFFTLTTPRPCLAYPEQPVLMKLLRLEDDQNKPVVSMLNTMALVLTSSRELSSRIPDHGGLYSQQCC